MAVIPESFSHVLAELDSLDPLLSALRLDSSRLKCTCVAVSRKWLALGSSGGGLHLVQREDWKQRLYLTHQEGAVSQVAWCPHDEDYIAVATSQGLVVAWELNRERRGKSERICVSSEHRGRTVTALCWDAAAFRVFAGDHAGKVSAMKINTSKQGKAAAAFVMFPVQVITRVDSRIVQLDHQEGRLLISSRTRSFLCDTEREKFWKIGNKERDGDYGACFFPGRSSAGQGPLVYCARPGSRMWETTLEGEVLSTHQFKQLLASPPLPVVSLRTDLQYSNVPGSPQSLSFAKLLYLSEHCVMTWTERGIYIFVPQSVHVLLWSEVKDIQDVAVHRNELFCLHTTGKLSHLSLLAVERCAARLLRRGCWGLAARVCCLFQNSILPSRVRKTLPVDKLEHLKSQLDASTQGDLIAQLDDTISKLEPLGSACSSRRSSISSHESFSVLDSGIYRVISRRGSQSDDDSCSLHSQTLSEDERLKEFTSHQEEDQADQDHVSHASALAETDRNETFLPFSIPLSFRSPSPLVSLQAVKESVSSFVRKTTEKIVTLHPGPDPRGRAEPRDDEATREEVVDAVAVPCLQAEENEIEVSNEPPEEDQLRELKLATAETRTKLQDPLVVFEPASLREALREWLVCLEKTFDPKEISRLAQEEQKEEEEEEEESDSLGKKGRKTFDPKEISRLAQEEQKEEEEEEEESDSLGKKGREESLPRESQSTILASGLGQNPSCSEDPGGKGARETAGDLEEASRSRCFRVSSPCFIDEDVRRDLGQLASLCLELNVSTAESGWTGGPGDRASQSPAPWPPACQFIQNFFFLLDLKRVKQCVRTSYADNPRVWETYVDGLKELTESGPVCQAIEAGDLPAVMTLLDDLSPWDSPLLLGHAARLYEKFGERALRPLIRFYPSILPADIMCLCRHDPAHFLAYLDHLVKSRPEDQRMAFLESLLQPESLRLDWLVWAVSHEGPHPRSTVDNEGNPRPQSHLCSWGYSHLILLLIKLPADFATKTKMADICKSSGFWPGYLSLCVELDRRREALTIIVHLDDMSLIDGENGVIPEAVEEWKLLLHLAQRGRAREESPNGSPGPDVPRSIHGESVALLLAKAVGPNRAWPLLHECGLAGHLSETFTHHCDILRIAETRQRALIQSMLEKCDRFLWSQQA
ncbi:Hermansky-Pudlak syndrome 5 protein [Tachyglossus aculeatus]|uniref:Hermansky-Pudlak syndrome 5 protein n=1 Tax=Tachyglossus aculeatus TaxID=9261 RepID=UPI0018F4462D|nr:Hermansky-Pudlak syndrome 5 protein [Tachyglossus aculeatus]